MFHLSMLFLVKILVKIFEVKPFCYCSEVNWT
nr:MAG TPA: hypothetical protein [Caudoviricetes sp.]